ncbi:L-ascorbate metabolism protein UlaG, beta-lactamase superfamily [Klenkia marina]|uniref:L-ascorbate metabolism protein UlaG, beta-lactamase superfamily n=1 Tax=Klenkia marina TaxID=1960309 RepID=A0A1G4XG43_9ACTN|nr:MBL fold metallo-hydrolase [Klenkia marina]SCX40222.1 L-ascorbate metabolism protein UlaG, beta-lactamase superfamily [Klenkia marina]
MTLTFLGHSTVRVELAGRTVLTDPVLTGRVGPLRRVVPPLDPATWADVDLVLLSHLHGDHLHLPSLRRLGRSTPVVVPRGGGAWLRGKGFTDVTELAPGDTLADGGLTVTGTAAAHSGHRWGPRSTHGPDAVAMGHLLTGDGTTVYAAGDTDVLPGMADLGPVDVALLPVWGWGATLGPGHMDPAGAALACTLLRPRVAVPVHWGTLALPGVARTRRMRRLLVDPPRRFADDVAATGVGTQVLVTEPGSRVDLP